jgi:antitoxin component YwqK of YwqJK toxin-antitoxin module
MEANNETVADSLIVKRDEDYRPGIIRYRFYNPIHTVVVDSIRYYFADTGTLAGAEYRHSREENVDRRRIRSISYFRTGGIESISFDYKNGFLVGDTIQISWHHNGVKSRVDIAMQDGANCPMMEYSFYPTGILSSRGVLGGFQETNFIAYYDLWYHYDEEGRLIMTMNYIHPPNQLPYVVETRFHNNENIKSIKMFIADPLDESGEERPIGIWRFYDENGELVKTEIYENGELIKTEWH